MSPIPPRQVPPEQNSEPSETGPTKEQYTLDEMLKALRDQEREKEEKGEIVTRSDGSVARKVKRRRRRTEQPEKMTPEKAKKSFVVKLLIGISVCLFILVGLVFLLFSFNTKSYREELEARAGEWTGAEVDLNGVKLLPSNAKIAEASFVWPETSYFRSLNLKRIQGDLHLLSFFGSRMGGIELGGAVGDLAIGMPAKEGSVGKSYEPDEFPFAFDRYYCDALNIAFGDGKTLSFDDASVSLRHLREKGFRIGLDEGTLLLKGWEPFPVASAYLHFLENEIELTTMVLEKPVSDQKLLSSSMKLNGIIPLKAGEEADLEIETSNFPADAYFGKEMGKLFDGEIRRSTGSVSFVIGEDQFKEIKGTFTGQQFELKNFPFLANLNELFPNEGYSPIIFDTEVEGVMRARPQGVAIESFEMAHKDIFKLSGSLIVSAKGQLRGKMTLLINWGLISPDERLKNLPGLKAVDRGYASVEFDVMGTSSKPDDTFRVVTGIQATLPGQKTEDDDVFDIWKEVTGDSADDSE